MGVMSSHPTLGSRLDATKGIGPGFDALRVMLSISILCVHSPSITGASSGPWYGPAAFVGAFLVPAFFALSGFLVIASAIRVESLATFLTFRGLQILPALSTEVAITALIIGPLATKETLRSYFTDPEFFTYFSNVIGNVHFTLPGVFDHNPIKAVNLSLWTIRPEIVCYLTLSSILIARLHKSTPFFIAMTFVLFVAMTVLSLAQSSGHGMTFASQAKFFFYFVVGSLAYLLRYHIPFHWTFLVAAFVGSSVLLGRPGWEILGALPLVYCTVFAGLVRLPMLRLFSHGDYSYGIYLFAYPIQQLVASVPWTRVWYLNILIALPITVLVAALSWHWIEKPFLSLKRSIRLPANLEQRYMHYASVRFGISFGLIIYAVVISSWAGLFRAFGTHLIDHVFATLIFAFCVASIVSWSGRDYTLSEALKVGVA